VLDIHVTWSLQYAVAVNRRGLEEKEKTGEAAASTVSFGKLDCIHAVAEAIQSLTPYISVDLTNPQVTMKLVVGYVLKSFCVSRTCQIFLQAHVVCVQELV